MKNKYSVYEAKTHLSEILRGVREGRSAVITDRGREVARVVPIEGLTGFEKRVAELERTGVIKYKPGADPSKIKAIGHCPGIVKDFLKDRNRY